MEGSKGIEIMCMSSQWLSQSLVNWKEAEYPKSSGQGLRRSKNQEVGPWHLNLRFLRHQCHKSQLYHLIQSKSIIFIAEYCTIALTRTWTANWAGGWESVILGVCWKKTLLKPISLMYHLLYTALLMQALLMDSKQKWWGRKPLSVLLESNIGSSFGLNDQEESKKFWGLFSN